MNAHSPLSTYFDIDSEGGLSGNVVKTKLSLRTSYEYYDQAGASASCAYLRVFSLGSFFTWAGVMDIYDNQGVYIGLIEGPILTLLPSKFCFYDAASRLLATTYVDADCMGVTLSDPENEMKTLANFRRIFIEGITDYWIVKVIDPTAVDLRMILSFAAFAVDHQAALREDN